jgi:hypothetical protein
MTEKKTECAQPTLAEVTLLADVEFLLARSGSAGKFTLNEDGRDIGMSSNSIVAIAYGKQAIKDQVMPGDKSDLDACERMWLKLPTHRKTPDAIQAMQNARGEIG